MPPTLRYVLRVLCDLGRGPRSAASQPRARACVYWFVYRHQQQHAASDVDLEQQQLQVQGHHDPSEHEGRKQQHVVMFVS